MAIASRESRQSFAVEWLRRRRVEIQNETATGTELAKTGRSSAAAPDSPRDSRYDEQWNTPRSRCAFAQLPGKLL
ncbi:hypothetical protein PCL_00344 [Purpureocillium lilacinum]|uniref:Uncharacterized protein n=1 Tax=Purpureocillium lilacinum TaxID=33203 RepID=A0A2U3E6R4_PURLI|nr:hypothetical protein PCL_00344 [Purpureocillium lilacinum]